MLKWIKLMIHRYCPITELERIRGDKELRRLVRIRMKKLATFHNIEVVGDDLDFEYYISLGIDYVNRASSVEKYMDVDRYLLRLMSQGRRAA